MKMECYVGIDLGSTTTKACIVDAHDRIIGRGITNSRSNYDIACTVARTEAFINARFSLFESALPEDLSLPRQDVIGMLAADFRREQHVSQLGVLRSEMQKEIEQSVFSQQRPALGPRLGQLLNRMEALVETAFAPGAPATSHFFRDLASSQYAQIAEEIADPVEVPFDLLLSLFDKCILRVENHALDLSFSACIDQAFARTLHGLRSGSGVFGPEDESVLAAAIQTAKDTDLHETNSVGTGYGRARLPFPKEQIRSEILCHGLGAHLMFPATATVLDIGGQDTKAIQVDPQGIVTSFQMNDRCAAGCGRYLGYIADEMNLGLHELGPMAQKSCHGVKINSTCTVFAGSEIRERLSLGQSREDILAGLHRAIVLRAMSLLARSGGVDNEFTFTGGVANNVAAVDALRKLIEENYGRDIVINISADSIYTGALGAAVFARRDGNGMTLASTEQTTVGSLS